MNKNEIILEIIQRVIELNKNESIDLVLEIRKERLRIYDANNNCKGLLDDYIPSMLYFDEYWEEHFLEIANRLNKILDKYEEV